MRLESLRVSPGGGLGRWLVEREWREDVRAVQWCPAFNARARAVQATSPVAPKKAMVCLGVDMSVDRWCTIVVGSVALEDFPRKVGIRFEYVAGWSNSLKDSLRS